MAYCKRIGWLSVLYAACVLLGGCVTGYPGAEDSLPFSYPLAHCDPDDKALRAAAVQSTRLDTAPQLAAANVCVTMPVTVEGMPEEGETGERKRLEAQAFARQEAHLRDLLEAPFIAATTSTSTFGVALSGGGSKAAAFATGVLAGLSDGAILDRANFISSVSGGGYATYFYYAHRLLPVVRGGGRPHASNDDLYRDCIGVSEPDGLVSPDLRARIESVNYCNRFTLTSLAHDAESRRADLRYQAYLKCSQDLLRPGVCTMHSTAGVDSGQNDVRLFIVKPAINLADFIVLQREKTTRAPLLTDCQLRGQPERRPKLINCDTAIFLQGNPPKPGKCPVFPQHSTVLATANSSGTIFTAYRELARQYVAGVAPMIDAIAKGDPNGRAWFESMALDQHAAPVERIHNGGALTCAGPATT